MLPSCVSFCMVFDSAEAAAFVGLFDFNLKARNRLERGLITPALAD